MNIQDKVAVITGGASGLGLATAKALKEKGAKLMLLDWMAIMFKILDFKRWKKFLRDIKN